MSRLERAVLLVGSPRGPRSTSAALGGYLLERLAERGVAGETFMAIPATSNPANTEALLAAVDGADLLVLAFPLYVDQLPAPLIAALEAIVRHRGATAAPRPCPVVAICNSGFPESAQIASALAVCRRFAAEAGFGWAGGLALGGGGAINARPLAKAGGVARGVMSALDATAAALAEGMSLPEEAALAMAVPLFPAAMLPVFGGLMWWTQACRHGAQWRLGARPYPERG
jgi:hypothetical protein